MKRGAEAAAAAINAAGGVIGRNIKIVVEDDACDPKQAVAVANLIVGQQIKFVDGHACSGSSIPASDVYADNNVLMMSPASSNPALTEKGHPTIMRLYPRDDAQGAFIAPWIAEKYKGKKIAILHDKSAYGKGLATVVKETLNAGGVKEMHVRGHQSGREGLQRDRHQAEECRRGGRLLRRLSHRGRPHPAPGGRPGLQVPADDRRQPGDLRILGHVRSGRRGNVVHLPDRSAPFAERGQGARAVQGARTTSPRASRCSATASSRRSPKGSSAPGSDDPAKVAQALENGQPVDTVLGPVRFDSKGDIQDPRYDINVWHAGKYAPIAR